MPNTHATLTDLFTDIADAIRSKTGSSAQIVADDFPTEISNLTIGTDTSDATLNDASQLLSGITAYSNGQKFSGTGVQHGVYYGSQNLYNDSISITVNVGFPINSNTNMLIMLTQSTNGYISTSGDRGVIGVSYRSGVCTVYMGYSYNAGCELYTQNVTPIITGDTISIYRPGNLGSFKRGTYTTIAWN